MTAKQAMPKTEQASQPLAEEKHGLSSQNELSSSSDGSISSEDSSDNSGSESDSLDSPNSRKRRKTSQIQDDAPIVSLFSAPSRVKSASTSKPNVAPPINPASVGVSVPLDQQTSFEALNVKPWLVGSLSAMAIKRPTGIQKLCIPEILKGRDCIGGSRTGSGKTVAFAVPILQKWAEDPFGIFALVLTPTR